MLMSAVSVAVSYRVVWRLRFCSSLSCLGLEVTGNCEGSVGGVDRGRADGLKWPGGGKNSHSVLDSLEWVPI